jgi:hypothetical protein
MKKKSPIKFIYKKAALQQGDQGLPGITSSRKTQTLFTEGVLP